MGISLRLCSTRAATLWCYIIVIRHSFETELLLHEQIDVCFHILCFSYVWIAFVHYVGVACVNGWCALHYRFRIILSYIIILSLTFSWIASLCSSSNTVTCKCIS